MDYAFWQTVATTPWWIFAFVAYALWISLATTKTRTIPIRSITFWPLLPVLFSLIILIGVLPSQNVDIELWGSFALLGFGSGFLSLRQSKIRIINDKQIELPGSWLFFIFLTGVLVAKLYFGFAMPLDPDAFKKPGMVALLFSAYGLMTGLYIGRTYATRILIKASR